MVHRIAQIAVLQEIAVERLKRLYDGVGGSDGHGAGGIAYVLALRSRQQRGCATIDQINYARAGDLLGDLAQLAEIGRRLNEKNVHADLVVECHAIQRLLETVRRDGIRARHDHGVSLARVKRRLQLACHLFNANDGFARHMATALGKDLILDEEAAHARTFQHPNSSSDIGDIAKAGIAIGQDRDFDPVRYPGIVVAQLSQ